MANSDKNILISPFVGGSTQPNVVFTGQGNDPITLRVLDGTTGIGITAGGALSFEGSAGQLFSIVNRLGTGSIFSVNDISGIPSIDVDASGRIQIAGFTGNVGIGITSPSEKLDVSGNLRTSGWINANSGISSAGGTFTALTRFNSGISCAGSTFGSLALFYAGLSATGITANNATIDFYRLGSSCIETKNAGFTLTAADNGKIFLMTNSATAIMYFPTGLPIGFKCDFIRRQTGQRIRFFGSGGATMDSKSGVSPEMADGGNSNEQVTTIQILTNNFVAYGNLL